MIRSALKYGSLYFALVFSAGFVLGTIRVLALEPRIGVKNAELLEMPIMLIVIYLSARYVVSKMPSTGKRLPYFIAGISALVLLLLLEFTLVSGLQGISIEDYLDSRDEVAFGAYIVSLIIFAHMPLLIVIGRKGSMTPGRRKQPDAAKQRR
jgi:hypothetical protein